MDRHSLLVMTNCTDGDDAEFNRWYDEIHIPEVLTVPGIVGARRFRVEGEQPPGAPETTHRYLAIYEIEGEDPHACVRALLEHGRDFDMSPTLRARRGEVRMQLLANLG